jgi:hypothetical protein
MRGMISALALALASTEAQAGQIYTFDFSDVSKNYGFFVSVNASTHHIDDSTFPRNSVQFPVLVYYHLPFTSDGLSIDSTIPWSIDMINGEDYTATIGGVGSYWYQTYWGSYVPEFSGNNGSWSVYVNETIPEPSTWMMLGLGFSGLSMLRYRRG